MSSHPQTASTLVPPRRRRATIACRLCRKRKIKCITSDNPPQGPCERCTRKHLECEYISVSEEEAILAPPLSLSSSPTPPDLETNRDASGYGTDALFSSHYGDQYSHSNPQIYPSTPPSPHYGHGHLTASCPPGNNFSMLPNQYTMSYMPDGSFLSNGQYTSPSCFQPQTQPVYQANALTYSSGQTNWPGPRYTQASRNQYAQRVCVCNQGQCTCGARLAY